MQSGIDAGEELLDAGMHLWKFFMEIRDLADEIAKNPALAAQIPPALLSELFSDLDDFNNVDSKEQAAKLGKTTGKLLIFLAPSGAATKGINLGKYPRLLKLFNKAEARGTNKDASHSLASDSKPQTNNIPAYVRDRRIPLDSETVLRNPEYRFTGRTRDHVKIIKKEIVIIIEIRNISVKVLIWRFLINEKSIWEKPILKLEKLDREPQILRRNWSCEEI